MERASFALATIVAAVLKKHNSRVTGAEITVFAGGGNNGGDALYAGAYLARRGAAVTVYPATDRLHDGGLQAARKAHCRILPPSPVVPTAALRSGVWIDGLLGIGFRPPLRDRYSSLINQLIDEKNSAPDEPIVIAVDVPSGMDADTGHGDPVLRADYTVTMSAPTPGLYLPAGRGRVGELHIVDIGLDLPARSDLSVVTRSDVADILLVPRHDDHKYSRGTLGVIAGSETYPGAGVLTVAGALAGGCGMVRDLQSRPEITAAHPEIVRGEGRYDVVAVGPGLTTWEDLPISHDDPAVIDAGALSWVEPGRVLADHHVLTPHAGELAHLLGRYGHDVSAADITADPLTWVHRARDLTGSTILLKGATTFIAGHETLLVQAASSWNSVAGSGDVLTGLLGSLLAWHTRAETGVPVAHIAAAAAYLHAHAGSHGPVKASTIASRIPLMYREVVDELSGTRSH